MNDDNDLNNDQLEIELPFFIELKQSQFVPNDLGTYSRIQLNADQFIGNYKGKIKKFMSQCADPNYVWTILSSRQIPLFYIDASDPKDSNWLRFIRSTSDVNKYNVICLQQDKKISYFTFKEIKIGDELVTYLPGKKKKPNNKTFQNLTYFLVPPGDNKLTSKKSMEETIKDDSLQLDNKSDFRAHSIIKEDSATSLSSSSSSLTHQVSSQLYNQSKENENFISIKMLTQDVFKNDDYFFNFYFTLKLNNFKKLRRRLFKCDLCSYTAIVDSNGDDTLIKQHIINEHIALRDPNEPLEYVLNDLIDLMIRKIENSDNDQLIDSKYSFKCIQDNKLFNYKRNLIDHLNKNHPDYFSKLRCHYCSIHFDYQKYLKDYLNHLTMDHKKEILNDQLISVWPDYKLTVPQINWNEYFREDDDDLVNDSSFDTFTDLPKQNKPLKTWTCQMCKKQFDQRIDLSKHQCIELSLRLLKKQKELRKKKWREIHWKRKIGLSYIETSSLTHVSNNIADNLSFCIDGTQEDLKAYSREVRDYLKTELGHETQIQMFLKCFFPDIYQSILNKVTSTTGLNVGQLVDSNIVNKAISYFLDSDLNSKLNCNVCKTEFSKLNELIQHLRKEHNLNLKTSYENFKSSQQNNSPIGYLSCDPFSYLLNFYWDKQLTVNCVNCDAQMKRPDYKKHLLNCQSKINKKIENNLI